MLSATAAERSSELIEVEPSAIKAHEIALNLVNCVSKKLEHSGCPTATSLEEGDGKIDIWLWKCDQVMV